jgi:ABC-2 type transport system permease protein
MSNIFSIYLKELRSYFSSPVAYIAIAAYLFLAGFFFFAISITQRNPSLEYPFYNLVIIFIFLMPLLSMRLLSEEKKSGTLELLLTRPVREFEIVLGKYLSSATVLLVMMLPTAIYAVILYVLSKPDIAPMLTQYAAVYLVGLAFLALGLFASSLTENQIVAAVIAFTITLVLWLLNWLTGSLGPDNPVGYFAISSHFDDLIKGVIDLRDIVFYASFIVFWLYLTTRILDSKRWM